MSVHLQPASFSFAALLDDRNVGSSPELAFEVTKDGKGATLTKQLVLIAQESGSTTDYATFLKRIKAARCTANDSSLNKSEIQWVQPAQGLTCEQFHKYSLSSNCFVFSSAFVMLPPLYSPCLP